MEGPRVKATWLEEQFSNPFLVDATEVLVQQYARFYILGCWVVRCLWTSLANGSQLCICNFSIQSAIERIIVGVVQH